jgi:DNA polymerase-1
VEQTELIKTYFGRVRKLEWRGKDNYTADMIKNSGFNTMIQGTCADITKIAMLRVQDRVLDKYPEDVVQMKLQVHDELDFIVRNDMLDEVCAVIKNAMTIPTPDDWVDFEIDVEIGPSWSEMDHTDWEGAWTLDKFTGWGDIVPKKYQSYLTVPGYSATWGGYGKGGN